MVESKTALGTRNGMRVNAAISILSDIGGIDGLDRGLSFPQIGIIRNEDMGLAENLSRSLNYLLMRNVGWKLNAVHDRSRVK